MYMLSEKFATSVTIVIQSLSLSLSFYNARCICVRKSTLFSLSEHSFAIHICIISSCLACSPCLCVCVSITRNERGERGRESKVDLYTEHLTL